MNLSPEELEDLMRLKPEIGVTEFSELKRSIDGLVECKKYEPKPFIRYLGLKPSVENGQSIDKLTTEYFEKAGCTVTANGGFSWKIEKENEPLCLVIIDPYVRVLFDGIKLEHSDEGYESLFHKIMGLPSNNPSNGCNERPLAIDYGIRLLKYAEKHS